MENSQKPGGGKTIKQAYREAYLINGFLKQTLTEGEKRELDDWILASEENMIRFEKMTDEKNLALFNKWIKKMNVDEGFAKTKRKINARRFRRYAVAASVILAIALGTYFIQKSGNTKDNPSMAAQKQDISPGSDKATLTLDNGKIIELGTDGADTTINDQVKILRKDGQLIYSSAAPANEIVYHTLSIPRKGQYKLMLPDGTKVWLNSESSIRYPVSFGDKERKVFVTGETFFEVAKDKNKPFRVVKDDITVEALGTEFNVNAYLNEPYVATTLIEGSVLISKGTTENILKPGQQAQLNGNNFQIVNAETINVIAWKNNQFKFRNTPIDVIMRQIERWYDADVVYQDSLSLHMNATIERDVPVSKLLHILEQTDQVHFKIEGKKIIVMK